MNHADNPPGQTEKEIFFAALEKPTPEERAAFLSQACGTDAAQRRNVEALLAHHFGPDSFMTGPVANPESTVVTAELEQPGDRIGPYKLLEKIGEGGCGVVYMADQEAPVRRRVALKIIKLGLETKSVIARFEAERQALALMDHPNIAKFFDAGTTGTSVAANWRSPQTSTPPRDSDSARTTRSPQPLKSAADASPPLREGATGSPRPSDGRGAGGEGPPESAIRNPGSEISPGRPYFVMELVRGLRITDYCDQKNLSTRQRLDLFIEVCHAVQHAHQKGIIHRDLKPSNVLVTESDGKPVPKVIDFGIAKATEGRLTDKTLFTQFAALIGTPAYMSPEQAELTSRDIDTRSDIYSLGVLLYELLTGTTPFDTKELLKAGLDELRRVIREVEPPTPSTRLATRQAKGSARGPRVASGGPPEARPSDSSIVPNRDQTNEVFGGPPKTAREPRALPGADTPPLNPQPKLLSTDLDWIVMKCLEKDRGRRYETANGLAADLQRHLSNEPILARPPSGAYRLKKVVQRNKLTFVAAVAVVASLLAGLGLAGWQFLEKSKAYRRAVAAELSAKNEAAQSQAVAKFLKDMILGLKPSVAMGRDTSVLRELAIKSLEEMKARQNVPAEVELELRAALGETLHVLGEYEKAESLHRETLPRMRSVLGNEHPQVTELLRDLACVLRHRGQHGDAAALARESLDIERHRHGEEHSTVASSLCQLAGALDGLKQYAEAEALFRRGLVLFQKLHGPEHHEIAHALIGLAGCLDHQGRHEKAVALYRESVAMMRNVHGASDPNVAYVLREFAISEGNHQRDREAEELYRELLPMQRRFLGNENSKTAETLNNLACYLVNRGRPVEAESVARESLAIYKKVHGVEHKDVAKAMHDLGMSLANQGRRAEAEPLLREALAMQNKLNSPHSRHVITSLRNLGRLLVEQERFSEAEPVYRDLLRCLESAPVQDSSQVLEDSAKLGRLLTDWAWAERSKNSAVRNPQSEMVRRAREAERRLRECIESRINGTNATPWRIGEWKTRLGAALVSVVVTDSELSSTERVAKLTEAERLLLEGNESVHKDPASESRYKRNTLERLIRLYEAWDKPAQIAEWRQRWIAFQQALGKSVPTPEVRE